MPFVPNQRRRWFGLLYLISSAGLLIWGFTLLYPVLRGWWFVAYWTVCFLCAWLALITAWLDWRAIRRQAREEKRKLLHEALTQIAREAPARPATRDQPADQPPNRPPTDA